MAISKIKVGTTEHDLTAARVGTTDVGSTTQPVYIDDGVPKAISYTIAKSVPSNAVFTDTKYTHPAYTARTGVPAANATLTFGGAFNVSQPVSDATGHITAVNSRTYTMPSDRLFTTLTPTGTAITATGTDLKSTTYLKVGRYYCSANATAQTLKNCPTSVAFMMEVFSPLSPTVDNEDTSTYVYRLRKITEYNTGVQYIQFVSSGATKGVFTYNSWYVIPRAPHTLDTADTNGGSAQVGSATQGVYVSSNGTLTKMTYTLGKSVPSNAVFTDTVYTHPAYTAKYSGLYKVTVDSTGHVSATAAVAKADITALGIPGSDTNTTYTFATGDSNGQIKVTPSGGSAQNISVKGLGTAAYTASTAYATAAQGTLATNAMPKSGGTFTGNATAYSTNRSSACLRNISVNDTSNTAVSTNRIIMKRK